MDSNKIMKKSFKITIKAKDCNKEFKKDFGKGILAYKILDYNLEPKEYDSRMFLKALIDEQDELMKETIETTVEEIKEPPE